MLIFNVINPIEFIMFITTIQVLLDSTIDDDVLGHAMPNLIYVSREKCKDIPHHFKGGALNVLVTYLTIYTSFRTKTTLI